MNKKIFSERIKSFEFVTLFNELGWDRFEDKLNRITVEQTAYVLTGIAQKRGFVIVQCGAGLDGEIPPSQVRNKIEHEFSRLYQEHIIIFVNASRTEQKWQYVVAEENKPRRIRYADYRLGQGPELLYQKMKNMVFSIDDEENISLIDVLKRVNENFVKNTEQVTKKFYDSFKKYHTAFMSYISGIEDVIDNKKNTNKQWYASLMMNRLMFCYFIQKKGFLDGNINYLSDKLQECQKKHGKDKFFSFYRQFLLVLFHDNLGKPEEQRPTDFLMEFGKIPYLNGGLFDVHELEQKYPDIQINDKAFQDIFAFFDEWQWHLDTSDHGDGRHINPDVIGYIFEKYINDRAEMGAYYTKEDITNYIGQNCILPFLFDRTAKTCPAAMKPDGFVWTYLKGSGDTYIYDAVKHGVPADGSNLRTGLPSDVLLGFDGDLAQKIVSDETEVHLWQKRQCWNRKVEDSDLALPTETWRELIARRERCAELRQKISSGAITQINDFITYNLNIRQFTQDIVENCPDPEFIQEFYKALKTVTVLDPTCGSGAFLFAALNILEPLYAACIRRMEDFVTEAKPGCFKFFEVELAEVNNDKHPNQDYFIIKSIILHNLYGVDIMKEAVEIAKLRLFLKLVATVDVNKRKLNMGLEPLPDIDFNIRAGNTLVGFATEKELIDGMNEGLFTQQRVAEFKNKTALVAQAFKRFQDAQLARKPYHEFKAEYKKQLACLNEELNRYLANNYGINVTKDKEYANWKESHRPFHWFTEYYEIVVDKGGFDVVIGNPPYVVYSETACPYSVKEFKTRECGDLYAFIIERCSQINRLTGTCGMIVPISVISTDGFISLRLLMDKWKDSVWFTSYAMRPAKLFDGVEKHLSIFITNNGHSGKYNGNYYRWYSEARKDLFNLISYASQDDLTIHNGSIPKTSSHIAQLILRQIKKECPIGNNFKKRSNHILYHTRKLRYFLQFLDQPPKIYDSHGGLRVTSELKCISFGSEEELYSALAIYLSTLFFWYYITYSDCRNLNKREVETFPIDLHALELDKLFSIGQRLQKKLQDDSYYLSANYKKYGLLKMQTFSPRKSKEIVDYIDTMLATHYCFNEEELDFIVSYDIKFRMGDSEED